MRRFTWLVCTAAACDQLPIDPSELELEPALCADRDDAGTALNATSDRAGAPLLEIRDAPYTVTLVAGAPGYVAIEVERDATAELSVGAAGVVESLWFDGAELDLPDASPAPQCPAKIPQQYLLDLEKGRWEIGLGSDTETEVWLALTAAEG
jgi:hypothetical protein